MTRPIRLIVAGEPAQYTGGYIYDARIAAALGDAGWPVETVGLAGRFPDPDDVAVAAMRETLAVIPDGDGVVIDGLALGGLADRVAEHTDRLRIIALIHHPLADETGLDAALADRLYRLEKRALASVAQVVVTSGFTARRLIEAYDVPQERLDIIEPGIEKPVPRERGATGTPRLLCVASLIPRKGHLILVEALARIADLEWQCACIGDTERDPDYTAAVRAAIVHHGLDERIELAGQRSPEALAAAYGDAHGLVLASYYEGYGMVITEALAHGLPVVATTGGALADTLADDAGLKVPPGDAGALADALRLLLTDPDLHARLASGARRTAAGLLPDWQDAGQRFACVLERVCAP